MNKGNEANNRGEAVKISRFEDLIAWKEARVLTREIYLAAGKGPLRQDFGLRDQLQRASVSVMSNIAEGFERLGTGEKVQFMNIARASCAEVKSLLYVCLDNNCLAAESVTELQTRCTRISRLTSGLIRSVSQPRKRLRLESESESKLESEHESESGRGKESESVTKSTAAGSQTPIPISNTDSNPVPDSDSDSDSGPRPDSDSKSDSEHRF